MMSISAFEHLAFAVNERVARLAATRIYARTRQACFREPSERVLSDRRRVKTIAARKLIGIELVHPCRIRIANSRADRLRRPSNDLAADHQYA